MKLAIAVVAVAACARPMAPAPHYAALFARGASSGGSTHDTTFELIR